MNVQDLSFLLSQGPAELLDRPLEDYAALLRQAVDLEPDHLEAVDYALRHTVVRLLVRAAGEEEMEAAYDALRRMVPVARASELAEWIPRWRAFADLLDTRLGILASREPGLALRFAHAEPILHLVADAPGLTQVEIGERLELKPANLSRVLGVLEAHEMIERRRVGREKRVYLGRLAPGLAKERPELETDPKLLFDGEPVKPGVAYFRAA